MAAGEVKQDFWLNCYCPASTCTRNWVCLSCWRSYLSSRVQLWREIHQPESFVWVYTWGMALHKPEKRVGVKVASFKDKVVMETVKIYFGREAYVKMLCNFLAEKTEYEQPFSICWGEERKSGSGNSCKAEEKVMRNEAKFILSVQ